MAEKFEYTREWTDANAFPMLGFSKSWKNPEDYPTIELDEDKVREDMQSLHDEVKNYINTKLIPAVLAEDATEEARAAAEEARVAAEEARVAAEKARADENTGIVAQATEQAAIAASKASEASFSENNAKAYANGGAHKEQSASGGITVTNVVGAKDYANQAKVYAEGGSFDPNPHDGTPYTARFDGAKNLANKAKAFAESGTYLEWENLGSGNYEQKNKTVSKGAKQYAEDAANSASAAADSKAAASDSASSAESFATAAEQSVASARSAASQASSAASLASEQKSQAQAAASYADKFATQARQHMEQSREYYQQAGTSANNAAQSAASAESAKEAAATSASSASAAASSAETFKNAASESAAAASTSETNAKASETAAKASENSAKASETAAKESETTAKSEADRAKREADRAAGVVGGDFATKTDLAAHTNDADIHVTAKEKTVWSGKQEAVVCINASLPTSNWDDYICQDLENDEFVTSGYIYIVSYRPTAKFNYYDMYADCGVYANKIKTNGVMSFWANKNPSKSLTISILKIAAPGASGEVYNTGSQWIDRDALSGTIDKVDFLYNGYQHNTYIKSEKTIPSGRMVGDVDGDGKITEYDADLVLEYSGGMTTLTDIQKQCADITGTNGINATDSSYIRQVASGKLKHGQYCSDILGNWTVNPNYATEDAQFYTDIPVSGMTAGQDISIIIGGGKESAKIVKVEAIDGAMRVWATSLPIEALPYKFVQDGPKTVSVTLAAASWDSTAKTQTVTVTGVKASETAQMITPTPALASQTAYYEAGILCTGQAADSLTFTCKTVPTTDLTVYVVMEELVSG